MLKGICLLVLLAALGVAAQGATTTGTVSTTTATIFQNTTDDDNSWKVRLVGGNSSKEGTVEIFIDGSWGTICDVNILFSFDEAYVICKALGLARDRYSNSPLYNAYFGEGSGQVKVTDFDCSGDEFRPQDCHFQWPSATPCPHSKDVGVTCDYSWRAEEVPVRLAGGTERHGRVEVFYNGVWGSVCGGSWGWTKQDATVVCRQLGLLEGGEASEENEASAGPGPDNQKVHIFGSQCAGYEENIGHCPRMAAWGAGVCYRVAGVACLEGGGNTTNTTTQNITTGGGNTTNTTSQNITTANPRWRVRLVGGRDSTEGRVEVYSNATWGTVCDDGFDGDDARVICKMVTDVTAFEGYYALPGAVFGQGTGPVSLTSLECQGQESDLFDCRQSRPSPSQCPHSRDASVVCNFSWQPREMEVKLDQPNSDQGRVQVKVGGQWRSMCVVDFHIARVICRQLGKPHGTRVTPKSYAKTQTSEPTIAIWGQSCQGNETNLGHCQASSPWGVTCYNKDYVGGVICTPGDKPDWQLRLVDGPDNKTGRLEVTTNGTWGSVCDLGFDYGAAMVMCKALGFSGWFHYHIGNAYYGRGSGPMALSGVSCVYSAQGLEECHQDAEVNPLCTHDNDVSLACDFTPEKTNVTVRLVGPSSNEGMVQVFHDGQWGAIVDAEWSPDDARVVCRQLKLPSGSRVEARPGGYYGSGSALKVHLSDVSCAGSEDNLGQCLTKPWGYKSRDSLQPVGVSCLPGENPPWQLRLVGGDGHKEGRLEVSKDGETWGSVCGDNFTSREADVACRMLGFFRGSPVPNAYYGEGSGAISLSGLQCGYYGGNFTFCAQDLMVNSSCDHSNDVGVSCDFDWAPEDLQLRLVGPASDEGRLEALHTEHWGTVCGRDFSIREARVVCRQLGLPHGTRVRVRNNGYYGAANPFQKIHLSQMSCLGTESNLGRCLNYSPWGSHTCSHADDVGIACISGENPAWEVRLVGVPSSGQGRVEVGREGVWGTLCDDLLDDNDARVICSMLGFRYGNHHALGGAFYGQGTGPVFLAQLKCDGSEDNLTLCEQQTENVACTHQRDASVVCDYGHVEEEVQVRLRGGPWLGEGRVEVLHSGQWGMVCRDEWDDLDALVVCRQLGLLNRGQPVAKNGFLFGQPDDSQRFLLSEVECQGSEVNLGQCRRPKPWGYHRCSLSSQYAGVSCGSFPSTSTVTAFPGQALTTEGDNNSGTSLGIGVSLALWLGAGLVTYICKLT